VYLKSQGIGKVGRIKGVWQHCNMPMGHSRNRISALPSQEKYLQLLGRLQSFSLLLRIKSTASATEHSLEGCSDRTNVDVAAQHD